MGRRRPSLQRATLQRKVLIWDVTEEAAVGFRDHDAFKNLFRPTVPHDVDDLEILGNGRHDIAVTAKD